MHLILGYILGYIDVNGQSLKTAKYQEKGRNKLYERGLYLVITKTNS